MEIDLPPNQTLALAVAEPSQIGHARRTASLLTGRLGFSETRQGNAAVIASEAAANLVHHGRGGELLLRVIETESDAGLELLALDRGPGMADVDQCLRNGYSTIGTAGTGLGAVRRLADEFDIYSIPGLGTAVLARVWRTPAARDCDPSLAWLEFGAVCVPKPGQTVSGDAWSVRRRGESASLLVADGLGHGTAAAEASGGAVRAFLESDLPTVELASRMHQALRKTRGAAVGMADFTREGRDVRYVAVGNISGAIVSEQGQSSLVSQHGTMGVVLPRVRDFVYSFPQGALLVMCSDGLTSQWRLDVYPGLLRRHPALIAGVMYRDFQRGNDDATVVVARRTKIA